MTYIITRGGRSGSGTGGAPSGPAGGDLTGTYPNPTFAAGAVLFDAYAYVRDEKSSGTASGGFTSGAWQTRTLNTEVSDLQGIVSLATNRFTLQAGSYLIQARAPALNVSLHKLKVLNFTDTADALIGCSAHSDATNVQAHAFVSGVITIAGAKAFELQHRCASTQATNGFGAANSFSVVEIYAEVEIYRFAA